MCGVGDVDARLLVAGSDRVQVSPPAPEDLVPYARAVERSARRIGVWNPVNPRDLEQHLENQSAVHRTFLVRAREPRAEGSLVGVVNVSNIVRGRFWSATMGYNAFDPYTGTGMFREGLALVVGIALRETPRGLGLHRVEANVRTGNAASAGVLRSLGFRRERTMRRMLWLADGLGGPSEWRDHDSYAITREEWPAPAYAAQDGPRGVLVVGEQVHDATVVAVARELGGVALFGLPFDTALAVARTAGAPIVWSAGRDAASAVSALTHALVPTTRVDRELQACTGEPQSVTRVALAVRPYLT